MFHQSSLANEASTYVADTTIELQRAMASKAMYVVMALYLVWHIIGTLLWPVQLGMLLWLNFAVVMGAFGFASWLHRYAPALAYAVWLLGLFTAITTGLLLSARPELVLLYAVLPLIGLISFNWQFAVLIKVAVLLLVWWLAQIGIVTPSLATTTAIGGVILGLLGWASTSTLVTAIQWSFVSFDHARQHLYAAREHRAQLAVLVKNLDQAYYRLERANAALVAARNAAEEAERFKAEFVTNVSHELRTPLNLIVGFSEIMMIAPENYGGVQMPGVYRNDLRAIYHSAQHLLSLVDDVLDLARIEAGKIALRRAHANIAHLVEDAVGTLRDYIAAKHLALHTQIASDLPAVWIDQVRVRQVLLNLLVNAARFTEQGGITVTVAQRADHVCVQVQDTGRGIPLDDLPKIFEEFRSTEQPLSTWHSGTGLGLPISKKFIELHGGHIGVESVYGQGTTFWFTLPCTPVAQEQTYTQGRSHPRVTMNNSEPIVVVVHEDARITTMLQRHLEGYHFLCAATLDEGTRLANDVKAVAVVMSEDAPAASASDIVLVRCPLPNSRQAALALGAEALLVKPVAYQELLATIERLGHPVQRVLIADDDPEVVRLFRRMLRTRFPEQGFLEAYNGAEALQLMHEQQPDLVLLDLVMPTLDGRGVLEHMAADAQLSTIPVIVISAQAEEHLTLPLPGTIQIFHPTGFDFGEITRLLDEVLKALAPGWQPGSTVPKLAATPPA